MNTSTQLINGFLVSELELFKKQFDEHPVPQVQDSRSLSMAWVCYYFQDLVSEEMIQEISSYVNSKMVEENYGHHGWSRLAALQAASYILSDNVQHRDALLGNIACAQLTNRTFILQSVGILCPLLDFNNESLRDAVEYNLTTSQGYFKECTVLYLCTQGSEDEKIKWIKQMHRIHSKNHPDFFEGLLQVGKFYKEGFFLRTFSSSKSYFIFKLLFEPNKMSIQASLFPIQQLVFELLCEKEKMHPLSDYLVDLSFLATSK